MPLPPGPSSGPWYGFIQAREPGPGGGGDRSRLRVGVRLDRLHPPLRAYKRHLAQVEPGRDTC